MEMINTTHLLTQEVTDFKRLALIVNDAIDGKVSIDGAHLVPEALHKGVNERNKSVQANAPRCHPKLPS